MTKPTDTTVPESHRVRGSQSQAQNVFSIAPGRLRLLLRKDRPSRRSALMRLLDKIQRDRVLVIERGGVNLPSTVGDVEIRGNDRFTTLGSPLVIDGDQLTATIFEILDPRAWTALIKEGSIRAGPRLLSRGGGTAMTRSRSFVRSFEVSSPSMSSGIDLHKRGRLGDRPPQRSAAQPVAISQPRRHRQPLRPRQRVLPDLPRRDAHVLVRHLPVSRSGPGEESTHKYDRLLSKLGVSSEHSVLEIGTGWGGFALRPWTPPAAGSPPPPSRRNSSKRQRPRRHRRPRRATSPCSTATGETSKVGSIASSRSR